MSSGKRSTPRPKTGPTPSKRDRARARARAKQRVRLQWALVTLLILAVLAGGFAILTLVTPERGEVPVRVEQ